MRETVSSLRLYFCVVGALGAFGNLTGLINSPNIINAGFSLIKLCVSIAIIYVGFTLKKMLFKSPELIQIILNLQIIIVSASFGLVLFSRPPIAFVMGAMAGMGVTNLICFYLLASVKRLSVELKSNSSK